MSNIPYVRVPDDDSDITADQFACAVNQLSTQLWVLRCRFEGGYAQLKESSWTNRENTNPDRLDDDEKALYDRTGAMLKELAESTITPAMVKIAKAAVIEPEKAPEDIIWSQEVDKLVEPWNAPVATFIRDNPEHESLRLAVAILDQVGMEERVNEFLGVIAGDFRVTTGGYGNRNSPVWACPRCEGEGNLGGKSWAKDICKRCRGLGYLLQDEDDDTECDMTLEGRKALNNGEPWTLENEAIASGYESLADAEDDDWCPPECLVKPSEPAGTSGYIKV
jgi:hypothetical protein